MKRTKLNHRTAWKHMKFGAEVVGVRAPKTKDEKRATFRIKPNYGLQVLEGEMFSEPGTVWSPYPAVLLLELFDHFYLRDEECNQGLQ